MYKSGRICAAVLIALFLGAARADASTISFTLDCLITGPQPCTSTSPQGTVTLTDNATDANLVDVNVTVSGGNIKNFWLNYIKFPLPAGYTFSTSSGASVTAIQDTLQADGYNLGFFDLQLPSTGNLNAPLTYSTSLQLSSGGTFFNLDVADFAALTSNSVFYASVDNTGRGGAGYLGALTCNGCSSLPLPTPAAVPEPASLMLLGGGLLGLGALARRRKRSA